MSRTLSNRRRTHAASTAVALLLTIGAGACEQSTPSLTDVEPSSSRSSKASAPGLTTASMSVVMSGLDAPRGLAFGPDGALYVAEAGEASFVAGSCVDVYRQQNCYSGTGGISRWWQGQQERVASGLPSMYNPALQDIGGPQDIGFVGKGNAMVSIGWGASPNARDAMAAIVPAASAFGTLVQLTPNGSWRHRADIAEFERGNAGGGFEDSNPFGILVEPGRTYVADAGGNTLVRVDANGRVSLVAVFPRTPLPPGSMFPPFFSPYDAVPTAVKRGPDGALWVSTLSGAPFLPGAAAIWRVNPGSAPQKVIEGLTQVTDFDIAADGTVWVSRHGTAPFFGGPSAIERIAPDGTRTALLVGIVSKPTGIVVGPDGAIYVSNKGTQANVGEVIRFVP